MLVSYRELGEVLEETKRKHENCPHASWCLSTTLPKHPFN